MEPSLKFISESDGYLIDKIPVVSQKFINPFKNFYRETAHFIDCVANGTPCLNPAEDGVELMRVLDALYESGRLGREVYLK